MNLDHFLFLEKIYTQKITTSFSWGVFALIIRSIDSDTASPLTSKDYALASYIELFIIATDLLDDFMDGDNAAFNLLSDQKNWVKNLIEYSLGNILKLLDVRSKKIFINNLYASLNAQANDMNDFLYFGSTEMDYFLHSVDRSVYLFNAIVQISARLPKKELLAFSYFLGSSSQIKNDIQNLEMANPSDLCFKKATLPILLSYVKGREQPQINALFHDYLTQPLTQAVLTDLKTYITNSGALEYSNYIALRFADFSFEHFQKCYPTSKTTLLSDYFLSRG